MSSPAGSTLRRPLASEVMCPNCHQHKTRVFYEVSAVPVHSVLLMPTREEAVGFRRGDIALAFCSGCGFVSNAAFDPTVHAYSQKCEETQGFSPTFQVFHRRLAERLVNQYDVRNKRVIEIGCGKGEFLALLCELGNNTGVGFDPAFVPERNPVADKSRVNFIQDFYSEKYTDVEGDFICCKMTLEHIYDTRAFMSTVRRGIGDRKKALVFFQIPDFTRILEDLAFWDIYYEHCSYFTAESLRTLFEISGFDVIDVDTEYDGQYLQILATPGEPGKKPVASDGAASLEATIDRFAHKTKQKIKAWSNLLGDAAEMGRKVVVWGSGSKAAAFLAAVENRKVIEYAVDINPYRHNHYIPGSGQLIVGPEFLRSYAPDIVIAMNAIYKDEIHEELVRIGCKSQLLTV